MFPANRSSRAPLRMLGPNGEALSRKYYSQDTGRDLDQDQMVRGYEYEKDKYVIVTDEELERLEPKKSRDINLAQFVPEESIPPIYFERGYFLVPDEGSDKAYSLLVETMQANRQAGIASFVMRGKEYLVAIFSDHGYLRAETMRFPDELRTPEDIGLPEIKKAPAASVRKFEGLISRRSKKAVPKTESKDKNAQALLRLARKNEKKSANVIEIEPESASGGGNVIDIMDVLKQSIAANKKRSSKRAS